MTGPLGGPSCVKALERRQLPRLPRPQASRFFVATRMQSNIMSELGYHTTQKCKDDRVEARCAVQTGATLGNHQAPQSNLKVASPQMFRQDLARTSRHMLYYNPPYKAEVG